MEQISLSAHKRTDTGKGAARRLRRAGFVPAVLYGPGVKGAVTLALSNKELEKTLHTTAGENVLVNLDIEGDSGSRTVMFREIARDPVRGALEHVDLLEVAMDHEVTVEVPVHFTGKSEGVALGGILQSDMRRLKVQCLPGRIPESIDIDVTGLQIGQSLHVKDIKLPEGVKCIDDPEHTVVSVQAPAVEAAAPKAEEVEEAAPEAGDEKPAEGAQLVSARIH